MQKKAIIRILPGWRLTVLPAAAAGGALATNRVTVDGHFNLSVTIDGPSDVEKALIYLAITDLCDGMIAVGGETAIGRGVFSLDLEKAEDYLKVVVDESQGWCDALLKHIKEGLGGK